jgi:hypothetical protein
MLLPDDTSPPEEVQETGGGSISVGSMIAEPAPVGTLLLFGLEVL